MQRPLALRHGALRPETSRRAFLGAAAAAWFGGLGPDASAHNDAGEVKPPAAPPELPLTLHDGTANSLQAVLEGHATALQLMFTSCQASCPIQGALFGQVASKLAARLEPAQLLSLSIDPARDTPLALRQWLERFGASARWHAARPEPERLTQLTRFLKSEAKAPDPHTAQVYFFDRQARLVFRSVDFPPPEEVLRILEQIINRH